MLIFFVEDDLACFSAVYKIYEVAWHLMGHEHKASRKDVVDHIHGVSALFNVS